MPDPGADPRGSSSPPEPGSIQLTTPRVLVVAGLLGGFIGYLVAATPGIVGADPPLVPWTGALVLGLIAAVIGVLAWRTYVRIHRRRERVEPQRAVGLLVLGKASALAGALIAGGYAVFGGSFVGAMNAPLPRERFVHSAVAAVTAVATMVAGLLLERACRVPRRDDDDPADRRT